MKKSLSTLASFWGVLIIHLFVVQWSEEELDNMKIT